MASTFMTQLRNSTAGQLFNWNDDRGKGRSCMLLSGILSSVYTTLSAGVFYTSFLMANGIDIVNIGVVAFIPLFCNIFSFFCPILLEKFQRRKWLLCGARAVYLTFNIAAITVTPYLGLSERGKLIAFIVFLLIANMINAVFSAGFTVWHLNFIPNSVRANFFSVQQIINSCIGGVCALGSSLLADGLRNSPYEHTIIVAFRWIAYGIALLEVFVLSRPKEFPYPGTGSRITLKNIFIRPFRNKKFLRTMLIVLAWNFSAYITASSVDVYLLGTVKISYTLINFIAFLYSVVLILLSPFWKRVLHRLDWFKTFAICVLLNLPTLLMYSCVTQADYMWLYPMLRIFQHMVGVGLNLSYANMPYINLPREHQTNYVSFYIVVANLGAFLGQITGTSIVAATRTLKFSLFGIPFTGVQTLFWLQAAIQLLIAVLILTNLRRLHPDPEIV